METPAGHRPQSWQDLDRDALERLLATGLTADEVGRIYGRSGSLVRLAARGWGLDVRALRARSRGLARTHPEIALEFVGVVDGAPSHYRPGDLMTGSGARCRWRCSACGAQWVTSVANRTKRSSGCPECARRRQAELARRRPARSRPLSEVSRELARDFVGNLTRPDRDASSTPSGSHDRVLWRCRQGHEWETAARQRVKYGSQCPACLAGLWTSRLEFEVAELVQLATGLTVVLGPRLARADRAGDERIDLLVTGADLLVDLDPSGWHASDEAVARDARKLDRLAGRRYVRVRPRVLGMLPPGRSAPRQQILLPHGDESDPGMWVSGVFRALRTYEPGMQTHQTSIASRAAARTRADARWRQLRSAARSRSLLSEHPEMAGEFVEAIGRPGLTAADLAPSGDDRVLWRCRGCGHEWEARVANRTALNTGCPPCSYRRGAATTAVPRRGESFADRHPHLVGRFVRNETRPGKSLFDMKPNCTDACWWTCPHCGRPWRTTPHTLNQNPARGCRPCGIQRMAAKRRRQKG
ncbi:zinc-ribbon domain-containing protein [Blastococcus xanthinilyticus]|uniref:Putative zinc ribbon protein n=1 Tax=Blastococcus xanthinilyticus TaxID=1564164 RepID=A0A5S5CW70_9ACTN|nr:zinc-ribbon domain-containing protein [Blastococcus xanthinilyticus]TYP86792.1 putative zinc ribbon protein [Blastococcus xanthinilyticus]